MWERRAGDSDFCLVRVGVGTRPLATRLVAPETPPVERSDPVTAAALQSFPGRTLDDRRRADHDRACVELRPSRSTAIRPQVRGLLRAMICQLAVLHAPGPVVDRRRDQRPQSSPLGLAEMVAAQSTSRAPPMRVGPRPHGVSDRGRTRSVRSPVLALPHVVVIVDLDERAEPAGMRAVTTLEVGTGSEGAPLTIRHPTRLEVLVRPDQMDLVDALVCARRLAGQTCREVAAAAGWSDSGRDRRRRIVRPDHAVAQPRPRRSAARSDRNHGRRRAA